MKKLASLLLSLAFAIAVAGCGGSQGSPADYPKDFKVVAGDSAVLISWTAEPEVQYWLFYGPGANITTSNWATSNGRAVVGATSPYTLTGLTNGSTYSFTINGRKDGGPGGPGAPTQVIVPQIAGGNWIVGTPLGTGRLNGVTAGVATAGYANIAVGAGGTIYTSLNGAATTTPTNPAAPADLNAVQYSGSGIVAVGNGGTILYSTNGTDWTAQASGTTADLYGIGSVSVGGFIAVGKAGTVLNGAAGTAWIPGTSGTTADLYAATFGVDRYVAVGAGGTIITTNDGLNWTAQNSGTTAALRSIAYGAVSSTSSGTTVITNTYVAVGAGGTVLTSNDTLSWTARGPLGTGDLMAVVYGGQFIAVGKSGAIFTSPDGITWTSRTSNTTQDLTAIARTRLGYTAVGEAGTNLSTF